MVTDFPSNFEREARHHERAVDEHRHIEELKDALDLASRRRGGECRKCGRWVCPPLTCMACLADAPEELRAINADLTAEVERRRDEADRERLARRDAERWLAAIRQAIGDVAGDCPNWDGSPAGLATAVASKTRRLEDELETANNDRNAMIDAINRLHAWRSNLEAEVESLTADRAALLNMWIVEYGRGWQIRFQVTPSLTYLTREAAEEAVLAWVHSRKR